MTPDRPALHTLRVRREFLAVAKGNKQVRRGLVLQARQRDVNALTDLDDASDSTSDANTAIRFGLTATKKIGNAVPFLLLYTATLAVLRKPRNRCCAFLLSVYFFCIALNCAEISSLFFCCILGHVVGHTFFT